MSTAIAERPIEDSPMESFAALFEESLQRQEMRAGEVITAEVVRIDQNFVVVNAGLKSESMIPGMCIRDRLSMGESSVVRSAIAAVDIELGTLRMDVTGVTGWLKFARATGRPP